MIPQLIIFDFDGTLADTTAAILKTYQMTIAEIGAEPRTNAECMATIGLPLKEGFRTLFPDFSEGELDNCVVTYRRIFSENKQTIKPKLYPGVKKTLVELKKLGIQMSIASSRSNESLIEFCEYTGIFDDFSLILGADDVSHAKPNPEPVLLTLEKLGKDADMTIVVGDMPVDIEMGRGAKCRTVGVSYGNALRQELVKAGASFIIDSFSELIPKVVFEK